MHTSLIDTWCPRVRFVAMTWEPAKSQYNLMLYERLTIYCDAQRLLMKFSLMTVVVRRGTTSRRQSTHGWWWTFAELSPIMYFPQMRRRNLDSRWWSRTRSVPLQPATRTWIWNENSGNKMRRTGFPLVPEDTSTAFMIQGATLAASIADCGDVNNFGGLSDMMTTYVILSRVLNETHNCSLWQPSTE